MKMYSLRKHFLLRAHFNINQIILLKFLNNGVFEHLHNGLNSGLPFTIRFLSNKCVFSTEEKKLCIERLKNIKVQQYQTSTKLQNAAVLIPFCNINGELSLLYTKRRPELKVHKGQVSFPGGKQDAKDSNLESTAIRETEEELGIHRSHIDVWGHGNTITGKRFNILPVIGYVDTDLETLTPNPSEVEFVFTIPLSHFYDPRNCRYTQYRDGQGYILPVYLNAKCKIWGLTAMITHIVLKAFSPKMYRHNVYFIKPIVS